MSKISIEGNASGTGTLTIAAPNTNTNYTLTLPSETGTLVTTGITSGLNASALTTGTVNSDRLPTVPVSKGGTGATTLTANNVILGNGTSAVGFVAPGSSGNILTSNGTTWTSATPAGGGVTSLNGQTGAITNTGLDAIGSYGVFYYAGNTNIATGGTSAGSDLRYGAAGSSGNTTTILGDLSPFGGRRNQLNNSTFGGGGTALSGTWRRMSTGSTTYASAPECGNTRYFWYQHLWVRIS